MTTFKNNIRICLQNVSKETRVSLCPNKNVNIDLGNRVVLKYIEPKHNELDNLDYESSGHTGFMPAKLSLLPKVPKAVQNGHLLLTTYDKNTDTTNSIELDDLRKREEIIYIPVNCVATEKDAYMNAMDMAFNKKKHEECIVALEFLGC